MGISGLILIALLFGIIFLVIGFVMRNRILKLISIIAFAISIGLFLLVWYALGYM